jgi:Flp pilus assembly protein TadB
MQRIPAQPETSGSDPSGGDQPLDQAPRRLRRGPAITLTCDCGERRDLRYGERWRCEECGRTWDTHRIPAEDYAAIRRIQTRYVVVPILMLLAVVATVVLFMVYGRVYAFVLLPMALFAWVLFGRPVHRHRLRQALDRLPEWRISPE